MELILFLFYAFASSFVGTIPPGVVNLTAIRISIQDGLIPSSLFSLGYTLVEMVYGLIAIFVIWYWNDWTTQIEYIIQLLSIPILVLFGYSLLKSKSTDYEVGDTTKSSQHFFLYGLKLGALNPMALPWWIGFCVFNAKKFAALDILNITIYEAGVGIGAFSLLWLYALGGSTLKHFLHEKGQQVNRWMGWILITIGVSQFFYIVYTSLFGSSKL